MKNQNRFGMGARLLALLMCALLLAGAFPAGVFAEQTQTGSLTVKLKEDTYANLPKTPPVMVTLYQIGVAAPEVKAGWKIDEAFSLYGILKAESSSELAGIAEKIAGDIVGKDGFSGTKMALEGGQARFSNLGQGVYLGVLTGGPEGLEAEPFIVTVPAKDPETKDLLYDYPVNLKATAVTEATAYKVWDDHDNQDGIRPDSLTVSLSSDKPVRLSEKQKSVTLNAANGWKRTVAGLPMYYKGEKVTYSWTETDLPDGYQLTNVATDGVITTLTNSHTPETVSATVRKEWNDRENQDGIRPANLTVKLSNGRSVTLNAANNWEATIDNLPKFADGVEIAYSWTEEGLPEGYKLTGNATNGAVTTLTNTHTPETVSATVRKEWDDRENQDGVRPASLTVKLSNGRSVTLNEANNWEATIDGLPKYANGAEIAYSWTEEGLPAGYSLTGTATEGTITTLTNSHTPETVSATVRKEWDDRENQDGIRPASLTVKLSDGQSVTLSAANNWEATIDGLPKYANGAEIAYSWTEEGLPAGYSLTNTATEGTITTLTNTHTPQTTSATVRKVWDDADDQDGIRPASLTVKLSNGQSVTLNEANNWEATIDGLPKYANGTEIAYSWTEEDLPAGYSLTGTATEGTITTLTNRHVPELTSATVRKLWDDDDNRDGIRPANLTVTLMANGEETATSVTLNEDNRWEATVDNLPMNADGNRIRYSWTEEGLPGGYELTSNETEGTVTTLTNRHEPERVAAWVRKKWSDNGNQDGVRPASLTVTLMKNGQTPVGTATLDADNDWSASIDGLYKYENGQEINYTWTETDVPAGYELLSAEYDISVRQTTLTNLHTPETTSRTVRKVWQDENNQDGTRPVRLRVSLWDDNEEVGLATLDEANNWTATIDGLPRYKDGGKEIAYYWTEEAAVGYMLRQPVVEGNITTLTNVHTPNVKLTEVSGQKIWEDNHNEHNVRPANVTILLYADGTLVNAVPIWRSRQGDSWSYTFSGLPAENANGNPIQYTVDEQPVEYYEKEVSGTTITNRLIPRQPQKYAEITGVKTWEDDENVGGTRPDSVTVHLLRNGEEIASVKVTAATNWSYSFGKQPLDDGYGNEYRYEVREDGVPGYFCRIDGYNLINRLLFRRPTVPGTTTTTNTPYTPTGRTVQSRNTATSRPPYEDLSEGELEETVDLFGYNTPLWGQLLGTGDETPIYPYIFGGVGVVAVIALVFFGRKRKKGSK